MRKILLYLALLLATASFTKDAHYLSYCNSRFSFCIKYPASFRLKEKSYNGDGATFVSKDGKATIIAYGSLAQDGMDKLEQEYGVATKRVNVTYKLMKRDWFVFSGVDADGSTVYQKTVKKAIDYSGDPDTQVFQTIWISYPPSQQALYEGYCSSIAKSL